MRTAHAIANTKIMNATDILFIVLPSSHSVCYQMQLRSIPLVSGHDGVGLGFNNEPNGTAKSDSIRNFLLAFLGKGVRYPFRN